MSKHKKLTKKITPLVLGIGIPASLRSFSLYVQQIIDTMFIGQYDSNSLLALSSAIIPFWMFESLWIGIMSATTVMIAQRIGAKNMTSATKVAQATFLIGGVASVLYFIFWQIMTPTVTKYMNLTGDPAQYANTYITTVSFCYLIRFVGFGSPTSILEALGRTKIIMWATILQSVTNIILDPLFIWGWWIIPEMGIKGAAIASVIAEAVAVIILSTYFWTKKPLDILHTKLFPLQWNIKERFVLGFPIAFEIMIWSLSTASIISMLNYSIPLGGALFNVGFLLSDMCYRLLYGFDIANMSLLGRSFGAKRQDRMVAILRSITLSKLIAGTVILLTIFILQDPVVRLFTNDPDIINTTLDNFPWILLIALITVPVGINMSSLNSMGYSRFCLYVSLVAIPIRVLLSYIVIFRTDFGISGVWAATVIEELLRIILTWILSHWMLTKHWKLWSLNQKNSLS